MAAIFYRGNQVSGRDYQDGLPGNGHSRRMNPRPLAADLVRRANTAANASTDPAEPADKVKPALRMPGARSGHRDTTSKRLRPWTILRPTITGRTGSLDRARGWKKPSPSLKIISNTERRCHRCRHSHQRPETLCGPLGGSAFALLYVLYLAATGHIDYAALGGVIVAVGTLFALCYTTAWFHR